MKNKRRTKRAQRNRIVLSVSRARKASMQKRGFQDYMGYFNYEYVVLHTLIISLKAAYFKGDIFSNPL